MKVGWQLSVLMVVLLLLAGPGFPAQGQEVRVVEPPDEIEAAQLVWTTMIAIDNANRTGNYSVLRDLAAPAFREVNNPARLATIFAKVRETRLPLGHTVTVTPEYAEPPKVQDNGMLRVKGRFALRPYPVEFDLLFQRLKQEWRLFGVSITRGLPTPVPRPSVARKGG